MVHKNIDITISVKQNRLESNGCRSIVFERPPKFEFESGDWIDIQFGDKNLKGGTTYSFSSSPTEPELVITFKDGISEIKKALASLKPGDKLKIIQYGNDYKFTLKPHESSTLIAGGVGIAPFRSMIKEMVDMEMKNKVQLLYLNQTPDFLFKSELEEWSKVLPRLSIDYLITKQMKRKDKEKAILSKINITESSFYIAGPEGMVESTEHLLLDNGADIRDIKIDSFGGY